ADPEKYAPQYGGYCAYGCADGHKAPTEIDTWTVMDGKLYFNYNQKVKAFWDKDRPKYIRLANMNWEKIRFTE
ncbi:MAG TPA: YHS domain-containing (seleno)protein, partial [Chitinophagaceae bacterium]|nr:YHS domain-containing (seleno)protein [Chitinophagaceae bacterium]